ncbi:hypothetical protein [Salinarimonas sp.]|uniref:hypothetical protein n=1 Tax=Salinarimonas sp. TaxID=2766526 RepID=UPI0032D9A26A
MSVTIRVPDGCDCARLVSLLSETLANLDHEHHLRLAGAARSARSPVLRAQLVETLATRHRERRAAYVEAIARLRGQAGG